MMTCNSCKSSSRRCSFALGFITILGLALVAIPAPCQTAPQPAPAAPVQPAPKPQLAATSQPAPVPQTPQAFEVASIRLSSPNAGHFSINGWGTDRFTATNVPLELLITLAYNVQYTQVEGVPGWLSSQLFNIEAKTEGGQILTFEQFRTPMRLLLEQRFHLAIHRYTKEVQGYALVVAKGGPKLQPSKQGEDPNGSIKPNGLESNATSLGGLAKMLVIPVGRSIIDKTGITGTYDFKLSYAADHPNSNLPDIFTALQEQLGLKLVPQKVPADTLVIDHVDRVPTEN